MWVLDADGVRRWPGRVHGRRDEEPAVLVLWVAGTVRPYQWVRSERVTPRE